MNSQNLQIEDALIASRLRTHVEAHPCYISHGRN
jgi:hypothetical protein